jgi:hypothetical protein
VESEERRKKGKRKRGAQPSLKLWLARAERGEWRAEEERGWSLRQYSGNKHE